MDTYAIMALVGNMLFKYAPELLKMTHDVVHDLRQHTDPTVAANAEVLHNILHGNTE